MSSLIQPVYATHRANESIRLGCSPIEIACDGQQIQCNGEAKLLLQPRLQLIVTAYLPGQSAARFLLAAYPRVGPLTAPKLFGPYT